MKNLLCCAFTAFLICFYTQASFADNAADSAYLAVVDQMRAAEKTETADWTNLRNLYTKTSFYLKTAGFSAFSLDEELEKAYTQNNEEAQKVLDTLRRQHYAALETHITLVNFYHSKDPKPDFIDADKEIENIRHIFNSILATGSGKSMKEAIKAISIFEQQALIQAHFKLRITGKTLEYGYEKTYDVYQVRYGSKAPMEMFFDITDRMAAFKHSEMGKEAKAALNAMTAIDTEMQKIDSGIKEISSSAATAAKEVPEADRDYAVLVATAQKDPSKADWVKLRKLFPQTLHFKSIGWDALMEKSNQMFRHVQSRETDEAFDNFQNYLTQFYTSPSAHRAALALAKKYPDQKIDTAASHAALDGLLKAIIASSDGTSVETAIHLNSGEELSEVLESHFKVTEVSAPETTVKNDRAYMHYLLQDQQTKEQKRYYFTIDMEALGKAQEKGVEKTARAETQAARSHKEKAYEKMVDDARKAPDKVDWAALRQAYTETMYYQPYGGVFIAKKMSQLAAKAKNGDKDAAAEYQKFYLIHFAHFMAQENAVKMAADAQIVEVSPSLARTAFDGLIATLKNSGDGTSAQTAYRVIDIQEEYFLLHALDGKYKKRPVSVIDNRPYDIFDPVDTAVGKSPIYFDVSILFQK